MCGSENLPAWNSNFERERREIMTNCEIWGYLIFRQTLMATAKSLWKYRMSVGMTIPKHMADQYIP